LAKSSTDAVTDGGVMLKRRLLVCSITAALLAFAAPGAALAQSAADEQGVPLTLDEALRIALENNLDLVSARMDPAIAEQRVEIERSAFDGTFGAAVDYSDTSDTLTITDNVSGATTDGDDTSQVWSGSISWSSLLDFGATYSVSLTPVDRTSNSRSVSAFTGFFQDFTFDSKSYPLALRYEMPLLRNFGREVNTERLVLARSDLDMSHEDLRAEAHNVLEAVEGAYWNVVAANEALRTAQLALARAEDLLELNRKKVEVGTLAPIEITQAEAGVASQQEGVIVAETTLRNAEDELRRLLAIPPQDPVWSQPILASDRPRFDERSVNVQQAFEIALDNRPEVMRAKRQVTDSELSERVAKRQKRHNLGLIAEATPSRADSSALQAFPLTPELSRDTTTDTDGLDWRIGLSYSVPLKNRQAKANYAIATLNREKAEIALQNVEQTVRVEVRQAARNVESGIKRVAAARKNVELQQEKLDAEQKKFENGMSTSFEVLTFQNDLADAELALIRAALDYVKAQTALERVKGTLLESRGLSLDAE